MRPPFRGRLRPTALLGLLLLLSWLLPVAATAVGDAPGPPRLDRLFRQSAGLRPEGMKSSQLAALQGRAAPDSLHVLVIGCDFSDSLLWGRDPVDFPGWPEQRRQGTRIPTLPPDVTIFQFEAHDAAFFNVQMGAVRDYFRTVSRDRFELTWDIHPTLINLPQPMGYYGLDDSSTVRGVEMARSVVAAVDADVDFAAEGYDSVVLIHAGAGQETDILGDSPEQLFSSYLDVRDFEEAVDAGRLESPWIQTQDGTRVEHVLVLPESEAQDPFGGSNGSFGSTGVFCFIFGLRLGMLNLADFTPAGRPDSQGIGEFGLMGFGLFTGGGLVPAQPCAFNRRLMGWVDAVEVASDAQVRLSAIASGVGDTLLVKVPIDSREYWLVEYRLQDTNGDLFFTFDDLNGNNFPDYFDADSELGDGLPTSPFDPVADEWESTLGAEWDFFMSENPARTSQLQRGGGSGLYIWHVDEGVIARTIVEGVTTVNADPRHKGIDLEEADGIQDLDSAQGSPFLLGGDEDSFRGEGAPRFGPLTRPSTETADGAATGILFDEISTVATDTLEVQTGRGVQIVYREAMTFRLRFLPPEAGADEAGRRTFPEDPPRFDVRVVDLGTAPGFPDSDGALEIVTAGDGGRVYALRGDLTEWIDGDGDPGTIGVLARAVGPDGPPAWLGSPAVADLDGDGVQDVVLAAPDGLYSFSTGDGGELVDGDQDASTVGVLWRGQLTQPPTVVLRSPALPAAVAMVRGEGELQLVRIEIEAGSVVTSPLASLAAASPTTPVTVWRGAGSSAAAVVSGVEVEGQPALWSVALDGFQSQVLPQPAPFAPAAPLAFDFGAAQLAWVDSTGSIQAEVAPGAPAARAETEPSTPPPLRSEARGGPWSAVVGGPRRVQGAPLLAYAAEHSLVLLDRGLRSVTGGPYRAEYVGERVVGPSRASDPLLVDLIEGGDVEVLWQDAVGRIHAVSSDATPLEGWPLAGPAEPSGSPAVGDVDGDGRLELVALGTFETVLSADGPGRSVETRSAGELRVYDLAAPVDAFAPWPQGRGGPDGAGRQDLAAPAAGSTSSGQFLESGTATVRPSPATGATIRARVRVLRLTGTVTATVYNLEGEEVASTSRFVPAGSWFDETIAIDQLASGYYICRFHTEDESQTRAFVVVR